MIKHEIENVGFIEYRLPTIPEKMRLLHKMGMSPSNMDIEFDFNTIAMILENIGDMIKKVNCKVEGKKVDSWDKALGEESLTSSVMALAMKILNPGQGDDIKK